MPQSGDVTSEGKSYGGRKGRLECQARASLSSTLTSRWVLSPSAISLAMTASRNAIAKALRARDARFSRGHAPSYAPRIHRVRTAGG